MPPPAGFRLLRRPAAAESGRGPAAGCEHDPHRGFRRFAPGGSPCRLGRRVLRSGRLEWDPRTIALSLVAATRPGRAGPRAGPHRAGHCKWSRHCT